MSEDDDELDRLLAFGRTSGPEQDRMVERLLPNPVTRLPVSRTLALAASILLLTIGTLVFRNTDEGALTARGREWGEPLLEASCDGRCVPGQRLLFAVSFLRKPAYLAAYGLAADGKRVWYFPGADGQLPELRAMEGKQVVEKAITIETADVGRLEVHLLLLSRPLSRDQLPGDALITKAEVVLAVEAP